MIIEFTPYLVRDIIGETEEEYKAIELFIKMIEWKLTFKQAKQIAEYWEIKDFNLKDLLDIS